MTFTKPICKAGGPTITWTSGPRHEGHFWTIHAPRPWMERSSAKAYRFRLALLFVRVAFGILRGRI